MKRAVAASREAVAARMPPLVRTRLSPVANYLRMLFADHVVVRLAFRNLHRLSPEAWRSAQPLPHQIAALSRSGVRTVLNLRGRTKTATYGLEKEACARCGIRLVDLAMKSRAAPPPRDILAACRLLSEIEYPMLMHCKSGADRAGLMSAIYLHVRQGVPMTEARRQLSLRYGHVRQADTGILDHFLDQYVAYDARRPTAFLDWVQTVYDPAELRRTFRDKSWATRLVRGLLRRE